jgi:hypothetical protein
VLDLIFGLMIFHPNRTYRFPHQRWPDRRCMGISVGKSAAAAVSPYGVAPRVSVASDPVVRDPVASEPTSATGSR